MARKIEVGPGGGCLRNSGWVWLDAVEVERSRDVGDV